MTVPETQHPPGKPWICELGQRHFICPGCMQTFTTNPEQTETDRLAEAQANGVAPDEGEGTFSVCDDCYPVILERARAAGRIP